MFPLGIRLSAEVGANSFIQNKYVIKLSSNKLSIKLSTPVLKVVLTPSSQ